MAYDLLGNNFVPPDMHGKVTGKAKYAEGLRAEGMCRFDGMTALHERTARN